MALSSPPTLKGTADFSQTVAAGGLGGTLDCGTVTNGALLIVTAAGTLANVGGRGRWATPTRNAGSSTATIGTVTEIGATAENDNAAYVRVWQIVVTGGGTLVLNVTTEATGVGGGADATYGARWRCYEYTGQDTTTPIAGAVTQFLGSAGNMSNSTLGATPDAADEVFAVADWDTDTGAGKGLTPGTNFTELHEDVDSTDYTQSSTNYRPGSVSTSTTVVWPTQDGTPTVYTAAGVAFIVKAAGGSPTAPAQVTGLTLTSTRRGRVDLSWTAPSNGGSAITDYIIERAPDSGGSPGTYTTVSDGTSTTTSYSDTGLAAGTYWYRVSAVNAIGTGTASTASSIAVTLHPGIKSSNTQQGTSLSVAANLTLPSGAASGDLVVYFISSDATGGTAITASTGWTELGTQTITSNVHHAKVFARVLDGTTGNNILNPNGAAQDYTAQGICVDATEHPYTTSTDLTTAITTTGTFSASNGSADPPNCNPGSSADYLWLAYATIDKSASGNNITAGPTNYTLVNVSDSAASTTSSYSRLAYRRLTASSEDPGTTTNTSRPWIAFTLAIDPAGTAQDIAVPVGSVTLTPIAPSITGAGDVSFTLPVAAITLSGVSPSFDLFSWPTSISGRRILDQHGNDWALIGDAGWEAPIGLTLSEMDTYIDALVDFGFNCTLIQLIDVIYTTNAPNNVNNDPPYSGTMFQSTPDADYWAHVDAFIDKCYQAGITCLITPAYLGFADDSGVALQMAAASNAEMLAYGEFVGARYASYPNIIWAAGGDRTSISATLLDRTDNMMQGIANEASQLMTGHTADGMTADAVFGAYSWLELNTSYEVVDLPVDPTTAGSAVDGYNDSPTRPNIHIEAKYELDISRSPQLVAGDPVVRYEMWGSMLAGSVGHVYGNGERWHFDQGGGVYNDGAIDWLDTINPANVNSLGTRHMRHVSDFITAFGRNAWGALVPDTTDTFLTTGEGTGTSRAAAAFSTVAGVIYFPNSRSISVDLSELSGVSQVRARWFDPTDGTYTAIGTYSPSGSQSFTHPGNGSNDNGDSDWILVLDSSPTLSIDISTAELIFTPFAPGISGSGAAALTVPVSSLTLSGVSPTAAGSGAASLTVPLADLVLTSVSPAVSATGAAPIQVPLADLILSPVAPVVSGAGVATIVIPESALTLSGQSPSLAGAGAASVTIPPSDVALMAVSPSVAGSGEATLTIPPTSLLLSGEPPIVSGSGESLVSIPVALVGLSGLSPSLFASGEAAITIPTADLLLSGEPIILLGAGAFVVPIGEFQLSGVVPQILGAGNVDLSVPQGLVTLLGVSPVTGGSGSVSTVIPPGLIITEGIAPQVTATGSAGLIIPPGLITVSGESLIVSGQGDAFITVPVAVLTVGGVPVTVAAGSGETIFAIPAALLTLIARAPSLSNITFVDIDGHRWTVDVTPFRLTISPARGRGTQDVTPRRGTIGL